MNTDPYTPPSSSSEADNTSKNPNRYSTLINVLKWLLWSVLTLLVWLVSMFSYRIDPDKNLWALDSVGIFALVIILPLSLFLGLFLLKKIANPWLNLITYGFGLSLTFFFICCGFFAVLSGDFTVLMIGAIALALYCPLLNNILTRRRPQPPPISDSPKS